MKLVVSIFAICFLLLSACSNKIRIPKSESFFEIKTTACFGECPVYEMELWSNGVAKFSGTDFVDKKGSWLGQVNSNKLDSLKFLLEKSKFFELKDEYDNPGISDFSSTYITYNNAGQSKRIHCRYNIPKILTEIIGMADLIRQDGNWKKVD